MFLAIKNPKCSSLLSQNIKYMTQQGSTNFGILQSLIGEYGLHDGVSLENMENMEKILFRSARTSCRTFDVPSTRPPVHPSRTNFTWVHSWAVTLPSGLGYPSNRIFSQSWWCQLSKLGWKYKYKDKQGGRTWQPVFGSKNGNENFRH